MLGLRHGALNLQPGICALSFPPETPKAGSVGCRSRGQGGPLSIPGSTQVRVSQRLDAVITSQAPTSGPHLLSPQHSASDAALGFCKNCLSPEPAREDTCRPGGQQEGADPSSCLQARTVLSGPGKQPPPPRSGASGLSSGSLLFLPKRRVIIAQPLPADRALQPGRGAWGGDVDWPEIGPTSRRAAAPDRSRGRPGRLDPTT